MFIIHVFLCLCILFWLQTVEIFKLCINSRQYCRCKCVNAGDAHLSPLKCKAAHPHSSLSLNFSSGALVKMQMSHGRESSIGWVFLCLYLPPIILEKKGKTSLYSPVPLFLLSRPYSQLAPAANQRQMRKNGSTKLANSVLLKRQHVFGNYNEPINIPG